MPSTSPTVSTGWPRAPRRSPSPPSSSWGSGSSATRPCTTWAPPSTCRWSPSRWPPPPPASSPPQARSSSPVADAALVVGLGVSGAAAAAALARRGHPVVVVDDAPGAAARQRAHELGGLGVVFVAAPDQDALEGLVASA